MSDLATLIVAKPTTQTSAAHTNVSSAGADPDAKAPFVLGREIARGGMGSVIEADDCRLGRKIAVKVMLLETGASEEQKKRFVQEAAVLGKLAHPNIVPVYDVGRDAEGQLYYTMKLVKGRTLQHILNDLRKAVPEVVKQYTLDRLLNVFRKVCDALAFAHSQKIIHRDLKPENIMVGEFGEVLVMDWGISKILDGTPDRAESDVLVPPGNTSGTVSLTATLEGAVMGTPQYMSPEQAMGHIADMDARSDIFSLGGILYAILTLHPPVEGKDVREVLEKVSTANITAPATFVATTSKGKPIVKGEVLEPNKVLSLQHCPGGRVPPAISAVAMKALRLEKERRYQNVAAFSADIEKYQSGFATSAEQAGALKQIKLLMLRHKAATIGAAAVLIVGAVFGTNAVIAGRRAEQARDAAEGLINESIYGLRKKLMALGKVEVMEEMVTSADNYYRRLPGGLANDDTQRNLSSISLNRAIIAGALGQDEEYEKHTREALRITEQLAAKHPDDEKLQDEACYAMLNLCYLFTDRNDYASLIPMADAAVARCEAWLKQQPKSLWAMRYEVLAHNAAAQGMIRYMNKIPEGMARFQIATQITKHMREIGGETAEVCECEGFIHYGNANVASRTGQPDLNTKEFELSTASFARALELGGDSALLREMHVGAMHHAGASTRDRARVKGDLEVEKRGEAMVIQAFEGRRKLVELEPGRGEWWRDLAYSYRTLAGIDRERKDQTSEIAHLKEDVHCREEAVKRQINRPLLYGELAASCSGLASALLQLTPPDNKQAVDLTLRALEERKVSFEKADFVSLVGDGNKGDIERLGKLASVDPASGLDWLERARGILEPLFGKLKVNGDLTASYGSLLGYQQQALINLGRNKEASEVQDTFAELAQKQTTPLGVHDVAKVSYEMARIGYDKAIALPAEERDAALAKAEAQRLKAHPLLEQAVAKEPQNVDFRSSLGSSWRLKGMIEKFGGFRREAIADYDKAIASYDPKKNAATIIDTHKEIADILRDLKDYSAALVRYQIAAKLSDARCALTEPRPTATDFSRASSCWNGLGSVQLSLKDTQSGLISLKEALKRRERTVELEPTNRSMKWDMLNLQLEIVYRIATAKQPVPALETAAPALKNFPALLKDETDQARLSRLNDSPLGSVHSVLREQKRLPEATQVLRHIIALRQRMEALQGLPSDFSKSSLSGRMSLVGVLREQKLNVEADAELKALIGEADRTGKPQDMFNAGKVMYELARADYDKANVLPEAERPAALAKVEAARLKAHPLFERAVAKEPENALFRESLGSSWRLQARIEKSSGHLREAVDSFKKTIQTFDPVKHWSAIIDTHKDVAESLRDLKDYAATAAAYSTAIKLADARCSAADPKPSASDFSRASFCWSGLGSAQFSLKDTASAFKSLNECLKRRQLARTMDPANTGFPWDLLSMEIEIMNRLGAAKMPLPTLEKALPTLKDVPAMLKNTTDYSRLAGLNDSSIGSMLNNLRDLKRLPEATQVLRHIIALRQRMEELKDFPTDFGKSSLSARTSLVPIFNEQNLTKEADAELQSVIDEARRTGKPLLLAETHSRVRNYYAGLFKHELAEPHARIAYELAQKNDLGWRGIAFACDYSSTLNSRRQCAEAEKIAMAAWQKAAAKTWPGESPRFRADIANRLCDAYHSLHTEKPDEARDTAARVWIQRAGELTLLDKAKSETEFSPASQVWMGWLAQLADDGHIDDYKRRRTELLKAAKDFTTPSILERVAKAALILPAEGPELKQITNSIATAFKANPKDEWIRFAQCLVLLRSGKAQECLDAGQPLSKSSNISVVTCVMPVIALANRQLGHAPEADAALASLDKDASKLKHIASPTHREAILASALLKQARVP